MNAPIRYFGGKGCMFNNLISEFPLLETFDTYIEPFGGSYALGLKMNDVPPVEIYNDLDKNVYSLYKVLQDMELFTQFKERCDLMVYNEDFRSEYKAKLKDDSISLLDRAYMFFYVNRTSHNGIGGFSMNTIVRRNMAKSVSDTLSCIDRLPELHQRLSKVIVCNKDGIELIKKYNTPNIFIYADPPYKQDTRLSSTRYAVDMADDKQLEFLECCKDSKAKILISGYDNDMYNDVLLSNGFIKKSFNVNTTTGKHTPKTKIETVWKNY